MYLCICACISYSERVQRHNPCSWKWSRWSSAHLHWKRCGCTNRRKRTYPLYLPIYFITVIEITLFLWVDSNCMLHYCRYTSYINCCMSSCPSIYVCVFCAWHRRTVAQLWWKPLSTEEWKCLNCSLSMEQTSMLSTVWVLHTRDRVSFMIWFNLREQYRTPPSNGLYPRLFLRFQSLLLHSLLISLTYCLPARLWLWHHIPFHSTLFWPDLI